MIDKVPKKLNGSDEGKVRNATIRPIGIDELPALQEELNLLTDAKDPFASSAAYFGMTGRKSLLLYQDEEGNRLLMCEHPNREGVLLFPPYKVTEDESIVTHDVRIIKAALSHPDFPDANLVEVGRVPNQHDTARKYRSIDLSNGDKAYEKNQDKPLDWVYPVYTTQVADLASSAGGQYAKLRNKYNAAVTAGLKAEYLKLAPETGISLKHAKTILALVDEWATAKVNDGGGFTHDDMITPTHSLLSLMEDGNPLSIEGVIVRDKEDNPLGFWLLQKVNDNQAMSLARVSIGHLKGISGSAEFGLVKMAQHLQAESFEKICFGGSEERGLAEFKAKTNPSDQVNLRTLPVKDDKSSGVSPWGEKFIDSLTGSGNEDKASSRHIVPVSTFGFNKYCLGF